MHFFFSRRKLSLLRLSNGSARGGKYGCGIHRQAYVVAQQNNNKNSTEIYIRTMEHSKHSKQRRAFSSFADCRLSSALFRRLIIISILYYIFFLHVMRGSLWTLRSCIIADTAHRSGNRCRWGDKFLWLDVGDNFLIFCWGNFRLHIALGKLAKVDGFE